MGSIGQRQRVKRQWTGLMGLPIVACGALIALFLFSPPAVAAKESPCKQVADAALKACNSDAKGDYWIAGENGALPGIIMEGTPQVGDVYRQEFALGEAEDMAQVLGLNESVTVPYPAPSSPTTFNNCLRTKDFSPLEPGAVENKYFAPGVGQVLTVDLETGRREELVDIQ